MSTEHPGEPTPPPTEPNPQTSQPIEQPPQASAQPSSGAAEPAQSGGEAPAPPDTVKLPFPLQDNETVLSLQRRHWWFLWPMTVLYVGLAVVVPLIAIAIFDAIGILDDLGVFFWIPVALWFAYWAFRAAFNWYRYNNDIWLISNQRIVDSFKPHPFSLRVNTADLVNIQDIRVEKKGLTATMLNYGDVVCQTAGAGTNFIIGGAPQPEQLQMLIDRERDRERNRIRGAEAL